MDHKTTVEQLKQKVKKFCDDRSWDQYHNAKDLAIGIITESSELLEHFRFKNEKEVAALFKNKKNKQEITEELIDIFHTILRFAQKFNIDLSEQLDKKMRKNEKKHPVKTWKMRNRKRAR